ncbi:MAG: hypothetical protein AAFR35_05805 [Pseudomonadota bacterium]
MWRALIISVLSVAPAAAEELYPPLVSDYYCTDSSGSRVELGDVICIQASCQTWMARCEMSLNNPMWRKVQEGCPAVEAMPSLLDRLQRLDPA